MSERITWTEADKLLLRPFPQDVIKFRAGSKPSTTGKVLCLTYIDARIAAERIRLVDPEYRFSFDVLGEPDVHTPVKGILTILGVRREDVGQTDHAGTSDNYFKDSVSDALKRAAVQFGVGAYLYSLGNFWVDKDEYVLGSTGKVSYINDKGNEKLRKQYMRVIGAPEFLKRWGRVLDQTNYVMPTTADAGSEPVQKQEAVEEVAERVDVPNTGGVFSEDQITELLRIAAQSGGEVDATREWLAKTDKTYQQALALFKRHAADKAAKEKLDAASNDATEILTQTFDATNLPAEPAVV